MFKNPILFIFLLVSQYLFSQPASINSKTFIHIDQFGYRVDSKKVAVISYPVTGFNANDSQAFIPSMGVNQYQVRRTLDNVVVKYGTAVAWNEGLTDVSSGDKAWWFDFTDFKIPGEYYIYDVGKNKSSFKFNIGNNVYDDVLKTAVKMFYYNRCGAEKKAINAGANYVDGASFLGAGQDKNARSVFNKTDPSTEKDLSGGWWDAGDFNKYVTAARGPVNALLTSYVRNPSIWGDNYNIPESGNGIPDIVDEVKWELDWLKKMQLADGSSLIKVGFAWGDFTGTEYPSNDMRKRYYYPDGCSGATISSACVFAHAAAVFKNINALATYGDDLQNRAVNAWNNFKSKIQLNLNCDTVNNADARSRGIAIQAGDADYGINTVAKQRDIQFMAAVYLFALTGEQEYKIYADNKYDQTVLFLDNLEGIPNDYLDALIKYAFLPNATPLVANAIKQKLLERGLYQNYLRFTPEINNDAYRAFIPSYFYNFGSNQSRAQVGSLSSELAFYGLCDSINKKELALKAEEITHYFHGVNPFGKVYLSNMYQLGAGNSVNQFFHSWFSDGSPWDSLGSTKGGPPPGYLVGGPNPRYRSNSDETGVPVCGVNEGAPCNQPFQKSYKDFNDGFNNNVSYQITEPGIYYQAAYIQLLSSLVSTTQTATPGNGTGLSATYYNNKTLTDPLAYTNTEAVNFDWGANAPASSVTNDNFSARWEGEVEAPVNGTYSFATVSDDGVRLFVNDIKIIDNFSDHAPTINNGSQTFTFTGGTKYKIKMEYYESLYGAVAKLLWTVPGQTQTAIPKDRLFPLSPISNTVITVAVQSIGLMPATMRIEIMDTNNTAPTSGIVEQSKEYTNMSSAMTSYTATFNGNIAADRVRLRLIDNTNVDLKVDYLKVGNTIYQSKSPTTYSIGHWNQANGCNNNGYLLVDELYCNGYFQYNIGATARARNIIPSSFAEEINDTSLRKELKIFPNPTQKYTQVIFYTEKKQVITISITDIMGKNINHVNFNAAKGMNTYNLKLPEQRGIYFLQIIKDGKIEIVKVVKE